MSQVDNPEGWLFQAAKFQVWRMMQKEAGNENYRKSVMATMTFSPSDPAETLISKEGRERFKSFIDSLPAKQQQVYLLSANKDLPTSKSPIPLELEKKPSRNICQRRSLKSVTISWGTGTLSC